MRNKVLKTLGYVRNFTYLDTANITSKQKTDMAKVALKTRISLLSVEFTVFLCGFSYFPIGLGGGFHDYARTKNPGKSPYQWINPKNVTSIYKSTSQGIMLRN